MTSRRLRLTVAYDGGPFSGWQSQANGNGIQDHLEKAIRQICVEQLRVHGAGRTDAGVHALAQSAHFDAPAASRLTAERWHTALNGSLPREIRVMKCVRVSAEFHARFDATGKTYRYRIYNGEVMSPLEIGRAWHVVHPLDRTTLVAAATRFVGTHDFRGFAANRGTHVADTRRTINDARVRTRGAIHEIDFHGSGFLYKMVRLMVGMMVRCARGDEELATIARQLARPATTERRDVAPAAGLFLLKVHY